MRWTGSARNCAESGGMRQKSGFPLALLVASALASVLGHADRWPPPRRRLRGDERRARPRPGPTRRGDGPVHPPRRRPIRPPTAVDRPAPPADPARPVRPDPGADPLVTIRPPTPGPAGRRSGPCPSSATPSWGTAKVDGKSKAQRVNAIVEAGGIAYLGGEFTKMVAPGGGASTSTRNCLAAIDGATGELTAWNPKANGKVWALELSADGKSVYVGGDFSYIGGRSVSKLAKVDLATGKVDTTFKPGR